MPVIQQRAAGLDFNRWNSDPGNQPGWFSDCKVSPVRSKWLVKATRSGQNL